MSTYYSLKRCPRNQSHTKYMTYTGNTINFTEQKYNMAGKNSIVNMCSTKLFAHSRSSALYSTHSSYLKLQNPKMGQQDGYQV